MAAPVVDSSHILLNALDVGGVGGGADNAGQVSGGASIMTTYDASTAGGYGWSPTAAGIRSNGSADADNTLHGTVLESSAEFAAVDGSSVAGNGKRLFYSHVYSSQGSALAAWQAVGLTGVGGIFWLFSDQDPDTTPATDRTANCRGWCVGGSDTIPTLFAPTPTSFICADAEHLPSEVETGPGSTMTHIDVSTTPNRFDPSSIVSGGWGWKTDGGGGFTGTVSRFGYYDAYTSYEGEPATPGQFQDFYDLTQSEQHYGVAKGDTAQFRVRLAMEFGHRDLGNTQPTYFEDQNVSVEFSESMQSRTTPLVRVMHAPFNKIGLEEKLRSGDTFRLTNVQLTGATPWHFRFGANVGATVQFNNCIIQNAGGTADDCEIDSDVTIDGGLIDSCGKLSVNGGAIQNLSVTNTVSDASLSIVPDSNLSNISFSTNDVTKHAIEIADPGGATVDYTLNSLSFSGFDFDVVVLGTTGTVNLNILGGGDVPTVLTGTRVDDTPTLLGTGWVDGPSYEAQPGGGDNKRAVLVVVSNDDSKLPDTVTFGGQSMTLITSNLQEQIGLSMWMLDETAAAGVFTGLQTIAATWTGGAPTTVDFQAATYDHVRAVANQTFDAATDSNSVDAGITGVATVNALTSVGNLPTATANFTIAAAAGLNRALVVGVGAENGVTIPTAVSYGGQPLTQLNAIEDSPGGGGTGGSIWYLLEAGITAATDTTVTVEGLTGGGDEFSYAVAVFSNVDQSTPFRDNGTAIDANASVSNLSVNTGDAIFAIHKSTSGGNPTAYNNLVSNADQSQQVDAGDDPLNSLVVLYTGVDTTTGVADVSGGNTRSTWNVGIVQAAENFAGNLSVNVTARDSGLVVAAAQTNSATPFGVTFAGDVTERDQVDKTNQRVAVADYVESAGPATVTASVTDSSLATGDDAQLIAASLVPSFELIDGPAVNILATTSITITGLRDNTEVRILDAADNNIELAGIEVATDGSPDDRSFTFNLQAGTVVDIVVFNIDFILSPNNRIEAFTIPANDSSIPVTQIEDRVFENPV